MERSEVMLTKRQNQDHHRHDSGLHYPRLLVLLVELCSTRVSGAGCGRFTHLHFFLLCYPVVVFSSLVWTERSNMMLRVVVVRNVQGIYLRHYAMCIDG